VKRGIGLEVEASAGRYGILFCYQQRCIYICVAAGRTLHSCDDSIS
jgi:hypothetical protein